MLVLFLRSLSPSTTAQPRSHDSTVSLFFRWSVGGPRALSGLPEWVKTIFFSAESLFLMIFTPEHGIMEIITSKGGSA